MDYRLPADDTALLSRDMIRDSRCCRLILGIEERMLHVVLYIRDDSDNPVIYRGVSLDDGEGPLVRRLEEAVYRYPVLLSDFEKIDVVIDPEIVCLLPKDVVSAATAEQLDMIMSPFIPDNVYGLQRELLSLSDGCDDESGPILSMMVDGDLLAFVRRTFSTPDIHHPLSVLARYFRFRDALGCSGKMHVNFRSDIMDMVAYGDSGVVAANSYKITDPMDAVYYIMALRSMLHEVQPLDELILSGDMSVRERVTPVLRQYIGCVMPVVYPMTLVRGRREVLDTPFHLVSVLLCE